MARLTDLSYHFKAEGDDVGVSVIKAVAFAAGRDPLDIESLARVIDTDALDRLLRGVTDVEVSFTVEDFDVWVNALGDIYVTGPSRGELMQAGFDGVSNMLLLTEPGHHEVCPELLAATPCDDKNVLSVQFSPSSMDRLDSWYASTRAPPANLAAICVGDFVRSASGTSTNSNHRSSPFAFDIIPAPDDLQAVDAKITAHLAEWAADDKQIVVCFDSVTDLFRHVSIDRSLPFLRSLTERVQAAGAVAHYHLEESAPDRESIEDLVELVDVVLTIDRDSERVIHL